MDTRREMAITVEKDGPYRVTGAVPVARQTIVADAAGNSIEWWQGESLDAGEEYTLCRCGGSQTKPFCDESACRNGFDGTETASREPFLAQAQEETGPALILTD